MKKRTLNEHRQIKEYQGSSEGWKYLDDLENTKEKRLKKLDEEITKVFSPQKLNDAAKAKLHEFKDVEFDDLEDTKEKKLKKLEEAHMRTVIEQNKDVDNIPEEIKEITLNEQIQEIAGIVAPTIHDVIFNEIIEVMDNYDELNWGYFVQDDAPTALLDACFDHKTEINYEIFQLVLQKLK